MQYNAKQFEQDLNGINTTATKKVAEGLEDSWQYASKEFVMQLSNSLTKFFQPMGISLGTPKVDARSSSVAVEIPLKGWEKSKLMAWMFADVQIEAMTMNMEEAQDLTKGGRNKEFYCHLRYREKEGNQNSGLIGFQLPIVK